MNEVISAFQLKFDNEDYDLVHNNKADFYWSLLIVLSVSQGFAVVVLFVECHHEKIKKEFIRRFPVIYSNFIVISRKARKVIETFFTNMI